MTDYSIEQTTQWVHEYWIGYCRYMEEFYPDQFFKFQMNIFPPQRIGGGVGISQAATHSDKDYNEIMKITGIFCRTYENPIDFPKNFEKLPDE